MLIGCVNCRKMGKRGSKTPKKNADVINGWSLILILLVRVDRRQRHRVGVPREAGGGTLWGPNSIENHVNPLENESKKAGIYIVDELLHKPHF